MSAAIYDRRKFLPPILPAGICPRKELVRKYDTASNGRYIFVSAPGGYGKSLSTQIWLSRTYRRSAWIYLDRYDDNLVSFYTLLGWALASLQPDNQVFCKMLDEGRIQTDPVEGAMRLFSAFVPNRKEYALVLDDFHVLSDDKILQSLPFAFKRLSNSVSIVILTRDSLERPFYNHSQFQDAVQLTEHDLAFSMEETAAYLDLIKGGAGPDEASRIHELTQGWAIGISALAGRNLKKIGRNSRRIIENYIRDQLLNFCDSSTRDFILKTAVADDLTPELSRLLTGREEAGDILESLYSRNFFISRTADGGFHYHRLVLEALRNLPDFLELDQIGLCRLMSEHYYRQGNLLKANHYAYRSRDPEIILQQWRRGVIKGQGTFEDYIPLGNLPIDDLLDDGLCARHPILNMARVWMAFLKALAPLYSRYLDRLAQAFPDLARQHPDLVKISYYLILMDHRRSFEELLDWVDQFGPLVDNQPGESMSLYTCSSIFLHRGYRDYHELSNPGTYQRFEALIESWELRDAASLAPTIRSGLLLEQGRYQEALETALKALPLAQSYNSIPLIFAAQAHLASVYDVLRFPAEFSQVMRELESLSESGSAQLRHNFLAYKARLKLRDGCRRTAENWLAQRFIQTAHKLKLYDIYQHITTLRSLMVLGRFDRARLFIAALKLLLTDFNRFLDLAEVEILEALIDWNCGQRKSSVRCLAQVLRRLEPFDFTHLIHQDGAALLPLIKALMLDNERVETGLGLDRSYLTKVHLAAHADSKLRRGLLAGLKSERCKLSRQQRYILGLLAQGLRNADVVRISGLSINTVKAHTREAYSKLEVNNLADALNKANGLGLLSD